MFPLRTYRESRQAGSEGPWPDVARAADDPSRRAPPVAFRMRRGSRRTRKLSSVVSPAPSNASVKTCLIAAARMCDKSLRSSSMKHLLEPVEKQRKPRSGVSPLGLIAKTCFSLVQAHLRRYDPPTVRIPCVCCYTSQGRSSSSTSAPRCWRRCRSGRSR